jgi:Zn-dependent protease
MTDIPLIQKIFIFAIPIIFAITVHEVAHGWVANKLGDPTAKILGRLTLNPLKHMDPIGTVILPLIMIISIGMAFGWAKPVPVDWRNLRQPKRDMALVAVAGPAANLLMLIIWTLFILLVNGLTHVSPNTVFLLHEMAAVGIIINAVLIALNLLPLPPLDGSRIVSAFLSPSMALKYHKLERWGLLILVALMFTGILSKILQPMVNVLLMLVTRLVSG